MTSPLSRVDAFCKRFHLEAPILLAPMAGACPPSLSIAVANAGGMGAAGLLLHSPEGIRKWMEEFRASSNGAVQLNTWIPDPAPVRDAKHETQIRDFLSHWGPPVPPDAGDAALQDFAAQCEAMLAAGPPILSSVMGLYPPAFVARIKERGTAWFAVVSTVSADRGRGGWG